MMYEEVKTLIVVSEDELVANLLKKYVETNDDKEDGTIVGTKDKSVKVVLWNEKKWLEQKKEGNIEEKILVDCKMKLNN